MNKFLLALACVIGFTVPGFSQMTNVTAASLKIGTTPISTGTVCAVATDANDSPITVAIGGGGLQGVGQSCAVISAGAITTAVGGGTFAVADEALAGNSGFYYRFTVTDTSIGTATSKQGFILPKVPGVTGSSFALDHYFPVTSVTTIPVFTFTTGAGAPTLSCLGKSFYQDNTLPSAPVLYSCGADSAFHIVTGTGGTVTYGTTAGTAAQGNDSRFATNAAAAAAAQTTANAAATPASVTTAVAAEATLARNAANLSSGIAPVARLGTGSGSPSAYLNGAGAFTVPGAATGTATPQGTSCAAGSSYYQTVSDGSSQQWACSANGAVWTDLTTKAVVYAGPATMYTTGATNCLELTDGSGTSPADACGHAAAAIVGTHETWLSGGGVQFPCCNYSEFISLPGATGAIGSTYEICMSSPQPGAKINLLGDTIGHTIITTDPYGSIQTGGSGGVANLETSLQTLAVSTPYCLTVVYDGTGNDQFWLGSTKLTLKNNGASNQSIPGGRTIGVGGSTSNFMFGSIYKVYSFEGVVLAPDWIQHNALVASARIAAATSLTVPTTPANYLAGLPIQWCIGDSITSGNGSLPNTYCYSLPTQVQIPGLTVFNAGTSAQTLTNYVSGGIFAQASTFLAQYTAAGNPPPPHYAGLYMGINDISANTTGATLYTTWKSAMVPLYQAGWTTIAVSLTPNSAHTSAQNTQRLAFNTLLAQGGYWNGFVDWANDLRMTNPAYPQIGAAVGFGVFSPYYQDQALHPSAIGAAALAGRYESKMLDLGQIGKGYNYTPAYAQYLDIDRANGPNQTVTLTGNVSTLKVINGNQGDNINLTICQDATGSRTVPTVAVGSGATATVTSAGVMTLTAGGSGYDSNYLPVFYVSGLSCTTYPRYTATITAGAVASIAATIAGAGCTGTGTVTVVSTEPVWRNFNTSGVNALAAGACLKQTFTFDGLGQAIN